MILDATFPVSAWRARFLELGAALGARTRVIWAEAPDEVVRERLEKRALDPRAISDAGLDVYLRAREQFQPPDEVEPGQLVRIDARRPAEESAVRIVESLEILAACAHPAIFEDFARRHVDAIARLA